MQHLDVEENRGVMSSKDRGMAGTLQEKWYGQLPILSTAAVARSCHANNQQESPDSTLPILFILSQSPYFDSNGARSGSLSSSSHRQIHSKAQNFILWQVGNLATII